MQQRMHSLGLSRRQALRTWSQTDAMATACKSLRPRPRRGARLSDNEDDENDEEEDEDAENLDHQPAVGRHRLKVLDKFGVCGFNAHVRFVHVGIDPAFHTRKEYSQSVVPTPYGTGGRGNVPPHTVTNGWARGGSTVSRRTANSIPVIHVITWITTHLPTLKGWMVELS